MLLRLARPSPASLEELLERARRAQPTYTEVGATARDPFPAGYRHDRYERWLGTGATAERAVAALRHWDAHIGAGVEIVPPDAPVAEHQTVLLMLRLGPLWTAAPCRVVYVIDDPQQFGFAYGTLPGHPEIGEAAFTIDRAEAGETVFRIRSFSRPADPLARMAAPISRRIQTAVTRRYLDALARAALADGPTHRVEA